MRNTAERFQDYTHLWRLKKDDPQGLSMLVLNCSRILILEHFITGEHFQCLGAQVSRINGLIEPEGDWGVFIGGLQNLQTYGPFVSFERDSDANGAEILRFNGRRSARNGYLPSRPSAFLILSHMLDPRNERGVPAERIIPGSLLRDWYRESLRDSYELRDTQEFILFAQAFIQEFVQLPSSCSRSGLLRLGAESGHRRRVTKDVAHKWTLGLIETLEGLLVLQLPAPGSQHYFDGYRIAFRIDPAVVLNSIFGRSTGNTLLDEVLLGGLVIPENPSTPTTSTEGGDRLAMSISGPAGVGKSCLSLSIAVQTAARGGFCLYLRQSQEAGSIRRQIDSFYRSKEDFIEIASHRDDLEIAIDHRKTYEGNSGFQRGMLWIESIPSGIEGIKHRSYELLKDPALDIFAIHEKLIIFDSIDLTASGDRAENRKFLSETTTWLRTMGYSSIFVIERDAKVGTYFEEFPLDLCIRLDTLLSRDGGYLYRTLEVSKSRHQLTHRGQHVFTIQSDVGLRVFPSSAAVLAQRRREELVAPKSDNGPGLDPGVDGFATYLGSRGRARTSEKSVGYWYHGSVAAIIGPQGTLKRGFAASFSRQIDSQADAAPPIRNLVIHFADEDESVFHELTRDSHCSRMPSIIGLRYDVETGSESIAPAITHLVFRAGHYVPGQILAAVRDFLRKMRRAQYRVDRAVIVDTASISASFPGLRPSNDPVFMPALCDLLTGHHASVLLVHSSHDAPAHDEMLQQIQNLADILIVTERKIYSGHPSVAIQVSRSRRSEHDLGIYELRAGASLHSVQVLNSFDLVFDPRSDVIESGKAFIILDAGTSLQTRYFGSIQRYFRKHRLDNYVVVVRPNDEAFERRNLFSPPVPVHKDLRLVMRHSGQLTDDSEDTPKRDLFADLWSDRLAWRRMKSETICANEKSRVKGRWVPFFLNPSFLVVREEFFQFVNNHPENRSTWKIESSVDHYFPNYTWETIITAAREFNKARVLEGDMPLAVFDFADESPETLNCLFLEIFYSLAWPDIDSANFSSNFRPGNAAYEGAIRAVLILRELLAERWTGTVGWAPWKCKRSGCDKGWEVDPEALVWRHWYSTYRQMLSDFMGSPERKLQGLRLLRLPGGLWTDGDWSLAALGGSLGTQTGANLITDYLVNSEQSHDMMAQGVGLTPNKAFYKRKGVLPSSGVYPTWFQSYVGIGSDDVVAGRRIIYRADIDNYSRIAPSLSAHLAFILAFPPMPGKEEEERYIVEKMVLDFYELVKRS